jgi:CubicO group peptidase (beta-lactamase class C family)
VPGFPDPIDRALWLDHAATAAAIAALAPLWPPGTASGYHPMTWGYIAGEVVRRVAGRSLGTILRADICAPGGIEFWIGLPEEHDARCAEIVPPSRPPDFGPMTPIKQAAFMTKWAAPDPRAPAWRRAEIPSANAYATALAVARLYAPFAHGGALASQRLVSTETLRTLTERRFLGEDLVLPFTLDWRAGVLGNNLLLYGPNPDALGHAGRGGSCGLADPARRLSAGYVMNKQSHHLMGDPRAQRLIEALYSCL